jgi:hypothetical protein
MRRTVISNGNAFASLSIILAISLAAVGCSVYDAELITPARQAATAEAAERSADADTNDMDAAPPVRRDASSSGGVDGVRRPQSPIAVETTVCGDGRVSGPEKCDIAIPEGRLGGCPTSCSELRNCAPRELNGSACQAECVLLELLCAGGDACCPAKCSADNDADCSASCGDGIIQASNGETCEPGTNSPCMMDDATCDDDDPCTLDTLSGTASNCNTTCVNTSKDEPVNGDSCCDSSANANLDDDCEPLCGNGVRETGEECDGESGCDDDCKPEMTAEQLSCLERFGGDECGKCSCLNCTDTFLACRADEDESANELCNAVLHCAQENNCFGDPCYCSEVCLSPNGPCSAEIEAAAGTTDPVVIFFSSMDRNSPLGRAYLSDQCRVQQCGDVCR